ncbi:hypothetical protein MHYP_G00070150 [Metynnis hypsauchen]
MEAQTRAESKGEGCRGLIPLTSHHHPMDREGVSNQLKALFFNSVHSIVSLHALIKITVIYAQHFTHTVTMIVSFSVTYTVMSFSWYRFANRLLTIDSSADVILFKESLQINVFLRKYYLEVVDFFFLTCFYKMLLLVIHPCPNVICPHPSFLISV